MRVIILTIAIALWASVSVADNNSATKDCLAAYGYSLDKFDTFDWSKAAACASDRRVEQNRAQLAEMRDFLKHNPRYRVPGQSLNRCWGKPREMPFKSAYIRADKNGFEAGVSYKDKLPAGCYENAPWDNRDAER